MFSRDVTFYKPMQKSQSSSKQLKARYYADKKTQKKKLSATQYNEWEKEVINAIVDMTLLEANGKKKKKV